VIVESKNRKILMVFNILSNLRVTLSDYAEVVRKMLYNKQNNFSREIQKCWSTLKSQNIS